MLSAEFLTQMDWGQAGRDIHDLAGRLYPLCRSLTGAGVRETLRILRESIPLEIHEVPTGTPVFDWEVPEEWNIRDAWVKDSHGRKVVDFQKHNLHILHYSAPVELKLPLSELKKHLHTLPEQPQWIPYRTAFHQKTWGFCLAHEDFLKLEEGEYHVKIDASLEPGQMTYGESFLPGTDSDEVLIYTHICHPSLANDNLSGIGILTKLVEHLRQFKPRLSYRFVLAPGNVGTIAWLALNEATVVPRIAHGLVLACVGGPGPIHYKKSRRGDAVIDRTVQMVLRQTGEPHHLLEFSPYGYADRQFCSPGFNLPVGCFMRTPHGQFPEYHTSADNLQYLGAEYLADSLAKLLQVLYVLDTNQTFINTKPKCEPRLGKHGLYGGIGGTMNKKDWELALLWVLNLSDGNHSLLGIAERSGMDYKLIQTAAAALERCGLLQTAETH